MSVARAFGRYNLHRLGWSAFEDLCMQVMRVVLGETCSRFQAGPDRGRDGWFRGRAAKLLASQCQLEGDFVIQCKHTSTPHNSIDASHLKREIEQVRQIAAKSPCHYILMTNRQVTAQREEEIRAAFEAISGVTKCLIFGETWIEDTIDASPRLMRIVPRLYGIGDLSQILSSTIQRQSAALLEDLAQSLRTFVPTDSYRKAEHAMHNHGFVVLVGPPASGKSAIAANLCMVSIAQNENVRVLRIEEADQFKSTWSPVDSNTIYWVDDVFGETTLDEARLREWSSALEKVEAARKRGANILFCTRDYILTAAERRLKKAKVDYVNDARVRVDVTALSDAERASILYNHIKHGDLNRAQKTELKKHLSNLARLPAFTPELARRLGTARFHDSLRYTATELQAFFEKPVQHFRDVIHGLSGSETAALAVCLLSNNAVPDPVPDDALAEAVLGTYSVSMPQIREAFEMLEGSLLKRVRSATSQTWQVHHPSMIEALQYELAAKSSQLLLYLQSARLYAVLRDTTTLLPDNDSRLVFLPETVYATLIQRFRDAPSHELASIGEYLVSRSSDLFLIRLDAEHPEIIDEILKIIPSPYGANVAPELAVRMAHVNDAILFRNERKALLEESLKQAVEDTGWTGFLEIEGIRPLLRSFLHDMLDFEIRSGFPSVESLYDWHQDDLTSPAEIDAAIDGISKHADRLDYELRFMPTYSTDPRAALAAEKDKNIKSLQEMRAEMEKEDDTRGDRNYDSWRERWTEERYEIEHGRFSDVDE